MPSDLQRNLADTITAKAPLDEIRILLASGAKINEPVTQGLHPLHYAVYERYMECVKLLLVRGGEINVRDEVGYSPLHLSAERGFLDIIKLLLDYHAQVDFTDPNLLDPYPKDILADEPLRLAIKNGHFECAKLLLQRGANPNARYFLGSEINLVNPLNVKFLKLLLMHGADPNSRDRSGLTSLMKAVRNPDAIESVLLLLQYGADVNMCAKARQDYRTVLHYAVLSGNLITVELLIKQGAKVNMSEDYNKPSPLDFAVLKDDPKMVELLIKYDAQVNSYSPLIGSPLHVCVSGTLENQLKIMYILLENKADPNLYTVNEEGPLLKTPIVEYLNCNESFSPKIIHLLLKYGARVVMRSPPKDPRGILRTLNKLFDFPEILSLLINVGEKFDTFRISKLTFVDNNQRELLMSVASQPLSLMHQARLVVREYLGIGLPHKVQDLFIPTTLKSYLLCEY